MADNDQIWDAEKDKKVKAMAGVLNAQMTELNKALNQFHADCRKIGYEVQVNKEGLVTTRYKPSKIVTLKKETPDFGESGDHPELK